MQCGRGPLVLPPHHTAPTSLTRFTYPSPRSGQTEALRGTPFQYNCPPVQVPLGIGITKMLELAAGFNRAMICESDTGLRSVVSRLSLPSNTVLAPEAALEGAPRRTQGAPSAACVLSVPQAVAAVKGKTPSENCTSTPPAGQLTSCWTLLTAPAQLCSAC